MSGEQIDSQRLERLRGGAGTWIGSADAKSSALLTVAATLMALLAAILASSNGYKVLPRSQLYCFLFFCLSDLVSIGAAAIALLPRTNRQAILRKWGWDSPLPMSSSFYGDLGRLKKADFIRVMSEADVSNADALEQTFVTVRIARTKMQCNRMAVISFVLGIVALAAMVVDATLRVLC